MTRSPLSAFRVDSIVPDRLAIDPILRREGLWAVVGNLDLVSFLAEQSGGDDLVCPGVLGDEDRQTGAR